MAYNLKHTGAEIDAQIDRVIDGSAFAEELAKRGFVFKGVANNDTVPDNTPMSFYLSFCGGTFPNFFGSGSTNLAKGLYAFVYDGTHWEYRIISTDIIYEAELEATLARYATKDNLSTELNSLEERVNTRMDEKVATVSQRATVLVGEAKDSVLKTLSDTKQEIDKEVDKKANNNEYYSAMAVGTADNLRGRGEATDTQFTYRPSAGAGNNIADEGVATMKRIKGNTVVWNQKVKTPIKLASQNTGQSSQGGVIYRAHYSNVHTGAAHKCLLEIKMNVPSDNVIMAPLSRIYSYNRNTNSEVRSYFNGSTKPEMFTKGKHSVSLIVTDAFTDIIFDFVLPSGTTDYVECELYINDLTQMFGAGYEPTTIKEYYELMPISIDANVYNEGELIPVYTESIETEGFNLWDEQWAIDGNRIYSKNLIPVLPNTDYYVKGSFANGIFWLDENKKTISTIYPTNVIVKSPATARYMKFYLGESYGTTYKNDICINLSHSGVENGKYEKYVKSVIELPEIAQRFPDGLKSAGAVFDEINETQAIKRVGVVDLGELDWVYGIPFGGTKSMFSSVTLDNILNIKGATDAFAIANILCAKYPATSANIIASTTKDKTIAVYTLSGYKRGFVADTSYTDAKTFKNAMSGVKLYFELAEPEVIELPQRAINLNYAVWDWGTERAVSSKPSAPFRADTIYGFNAVDTIRMNKADIEKLLQRVAELEARISSAEAPVTEE